MFLSYAFLRKLKDSNYYDIIEILNLSNGKSQFMQLENYDLAFRIDKAAIKLFEHSKKEGKIVYVDLSNKDNELILTEDLLILDKEKYLNLRRNEISKNKNLNKEDFTDEDLYFEYIFEEEKKLILEKVLGQWFPAINMIFIMYMMDFIEAQMLLFSRGYIITDSNKEDIFIEIIEKDDDDLIEVLEKYIESKDQYLPVFNSFKFFKKLKEEYDEISYWDYDDYEEAKNDLLKLAEKYNSYYLEKTGKKDKELFKELYKKIKEKD